jgi:hypothetical protein
MKKLLLSAVLLILCILVSCNFWEGTTDPEAIPKVILTQEWAIDDAAPGYYPITLFGNWLLIPQISLGGMIAADAETGQIFWRQENLFRPASSAVLHETGVYILGFLLENPHVQLFRFSAAGELLGYTDVEEDDDQWESEPCFRRIHLIGQYIFWSAMGGYVHRYDLSQPFVELSPGIYDPTGQHSIIYHTVNPDPQYINVLAESPIPIGDTDILFTYETTEAGPEKAEPTRVVRMNANTGSVIWEYETSKAWHFLYETLRVTGNRILVNGHCGMELIEAENPVATTPYWAYIETGYNSDYDSQGNALIDGKNIYMNSVLSESALRSYSLDTGKVQWKLAYTCSIRQNMQIEKGILYVSAQNGILMVDAARGKYIGRDPTHPGCSFQGNDTVRYGDLFIHFTDSVKGGRVEALKMDRELLK